MTAMNRRDAVKAAGAMLGGAIFVAGGGMAACTAEPRAAGTAKTAKAFSADDEALAALIADTILPDTAASPGAKAAGAGSAINLLLTDVYDATAQQKIRAGLAEFRLQHAAFAAQSAEAREAELRLVDAEARKAGPSHWFHLMHELSVKAYFSSEIGMTKALRYVREPGRFTGCVALAKGQAAWG
jgi:hypothetical protein